MKAIYRTAMTDLRVDGLAARMDRIKALGNGQVPRVAATAWRMLKP
jgi:hypothetical protein